MWLIIVMLCDIFTAINEDVNREDIIDILYRSSIIPHINNEKINIDQMRNYLRSLPDDHLILFIFRCSINLGEYKYNILFRDVYNLMITYKYA